MQRILPELSEKRNGKEGVEFMDGEKKLFHRTRIIIGEPYTPSVTGRHGTAEEMQAIADELLRRAYALGGQQVGGKPLCR